MLCSLKDIKGYHLQAVDGEIGRCQDFLFDDRHWTIRYMVANTHKWLPGGRRILVSPISLQSPAREQKLLPVAVTREDIEKGPPLAEHEPVSAQYERDFFQFYGYGYYWMGDGIWGSYTNPSYLVNPPTVPPAKEGLSDPGPKNENNAERHLRSTNEVEGYDISATDDSIGHAEDFIVDDENWSIVYLVIDTRNWLPGGRKVLIKTGQIQSVNWSSRSLKVSLSTEQIRQQPECDLENLNKSSASQPDFIGHSFD